MFQRFLFSAVTVVTVCAQQTAPGQAEAEKALRDRVQQFYQLQADKKYRQAEAFIAADTKDLFYASGKPDISDFSIVKIVMRDATHADVTVKAKVNMFVMGAGMRPIELPTTGAWKIEDGQWVWYVDQAAGLKTPFGDIKPSAGTTPDAAPDDISARIKNFSVDAIRSQVTFEPRAVSLNPDRTVQTVTITNGMPGAITLDLPVEKIPGIGLELDKKHLEAGEKANLTITRLGEKPILSASVRVDVSPLNVTLEVQVNSR
jgi:hypothetical protein